MLNLPWATSRTNVHEQHASHKAHKKVEDEGPPVDAILYLVHDKRPVSHRHLQEQPVQRTRWCRRATSCLCGRRKERNIGNEGRFCFGCPPIMNSAIHVTQLSTWLIQHTHSREGTCGEAEAEKPLTCWKTMIQACRMLSKWE